MTGEKKRNIILCGFMATGKSSAGKRLAAKMRYQFLDLDELIEEETGMTIPQIFSSQGEHAFRALESRMVERVAERTGCVVATGGGAIVNPRNLETLKHCGVVISLTADVQTIMRRSGKGDTRPLLQGGDKVDRIRQLMEQRKPFYALADIVLDTSMLSINQVVRHLVDRIRKYGFTP